MTFHLIGDSCGNCCFQYSHSVVHAKRLLPKVAFGSVLVQEMMTDLVIVFCHVYIYLCFFFLSKFFQELDFGGGALLVL